MYFGVRKIECQQTIGFEARASLTSLSESCAHARSSLSRSLSYTTVTRELVLTCLTFHNACRMCCKGIIAMSLLHNLHFTNIPQIGDLGFDGTDLFETRGVIFEAVRGLSSAWCADKYV